MDATTLCRIVAFRGATRYRVSVRWVGGWHWARCVDEFPQGTVFRYWRGPFLCKVMKDRPA
jgi:hypothetical protein